MTIVQKSSIVNLKASLNDLVKVLENFLNSEESFMNFETWQSIGSLSQMNWANFKDSSDIPKELLEFTLDIGDFRQCFKIEKKLFSESTYELIDRVSAKKIINKMKMLILRL